MMRYFTPRNLLIVGIIYWFLIRNKNGGQPLMITTRDRMEGVPQWKGEGYP